MKNTLVGVGILIIAVLVSPPPASKTDNNGTTTQAAVPPPSKTLPSAYLSPGVADTAITLWAQGRQAEALGLLLEDERSGQMSISPLECLSISEVENAQLAGAKRTALAAELEIVGEAAKNLSRIATARIVASSSRGERARAMRWASRLDCFGSQLAEPDYCEILQVIGRDVKKNAAPLMKHRRAEET